MARSWKTRYGHPFGVGHNSVTPHSATAMRGVKPTPPGRKTIPHPENRLPARVSPDLAAMRVWEAIENDVRIKISCDSCNHETVWTRGFMDKTLKWQRALTVVRRADRLRCGGCRSSYIRVWRG